MVAWVALCLASLALLLVAGLLAVAAAGIRKVRSTTSLFRPPGGPST